MDKHLKTWKIDLNPDSPEYQQWMADVQAKYDALTPEEKAARAAEVERVSKMSLTELLQEASDALAEAAGVPGWTYRDLPRMTPEVMKQFIELVGSENLKFLTYADYGKSVRGQVFISPKGMDIIDKTAGE